ncbi:hypothetical protein OBV_25390 [Oscillibacter valericigenes Sjm18-20]|nr:hypothetical protein OBV_25390 [Oscillibacter valericigenes Sjm18-20]
MNDLSQAKKIAAELGLDEAPEQGKKLSPMESAHRMTPNYYVEQMEKRKREAAEPDDGEGAQLAEDYGMTGQPPRPEPRDLDVITQEIVFYKRQAGAAIMEIGSRLNEAKSQMEHGQWLDWLREKVDISERNAQNFMRIAREYSKSAEIADLGATKALALLALPDSEREQFAAEKHVVNGVEKSVADMTGEELKKAIRERDEALKRVQEAQDGLSDAQRERDEAVSQLEIAQKNSQKVLSEETAKLDALKVKSDGLEEKLKAARAKEKETKAGLENAKTEKAELEKKLEELRKKPVDVAVQQPGEEELKKLREEAEAKAEEKVKEANARVTEAQARADAADRAAEELRRQLAAADKDTQAFKFLFDEWQRKYNAMTEALQAVVDTDPEKAEKLKTAIRAAAERMEAAE